MCASIAAGDVNDNAQQQHSTGCLYTHRRVSPAGRTRTTSASRTALVRGCVTTLQSPELQIVTGAIVVDELTVQL